MAEQMTLFDYTRKPFSVENKIRLIELFAGYGSQAMALRNIGADFETYRVVEFDKYAIASYNAIHGTNFPTIDINNVKGIDLGIEERERFTYLLTYLQLSLHRYLYRRKNGGYEREQRHAIKSFMASKTNFNRTER